MRAWCVCVRESERESAAPKAASSLAAGTLGESERVRGWDSERVKD